MKEYSLCAASISEINGFLYQFKFFAANDGCFVVVDREEYMQTLAEFGLPQGEAKRMIMSLTEKNYVKGPEEDRDKPGANIWVFGIDLNGDQLYIKLSDAFKHNVAKCISFHKAKSRIKYPY